MYLEQTANANPIALWSILSSLAGGLLVFVMARFAIYLYRSGEVSVYVRRLADLNPCCVKLFLRVENGQSVGRRLNVLSLYSCQGNKPELLARLSDTPLLRNGQHEFILGEGKEASLQCNPHSNNEAVLEFRLPAPEDEVYFVYTNMKGRKRKAKLKLGDTSERLLAFHHF